MPCASLGVTCSLINLWLSRIEYMAEHGALTRRHGNVRFSWSSLRLQGGSSMSPTPNGQLADGPIDGGGLPRSTHCSRKSIIREPRGNAIRPLSGHARTPQADCHHRWRPRSLLTCRGTCGFYATGSHTLCCILRKLPYGANDFSQTSSAASSSE